ncbi:MAG: hypothetical protein JWR71_2657 [Pseudarthrobacter sp.]|jgi:hypothetical protein|uniref:hypothetical protein n=1 Tax=Pseudarthrobacter TaxID=1742993 RepID=UPI0013DC3302|nr:MULTISPECIES: hypothetical protein [Pseudarthrobacter]MCU1435932.1 hypothetical protein [Pseudarthrobacter sp.]MDP9999449.1 hypothetical protein [Pseudarthrobacter sulfonivorans]QOD03183.1 hypothetical protein IDT60_18060 [Pseudarthrobacter sp. BIM B-2242]
MKKLATALIAAGLVLTASACTVPTKLSNAQTCERVQVVLSDPANNAGKTGLVRLANQIRPIEAVASDDLKPALGSFIEYADEASKETPDEGKLGDMQANNQAASTALSTYCQ